MNSTYARASNTTVLPNEYRYTLLSMYTVVLVVGICGIALTIDILKSSVRSVTTMAVLNLIVVHILFLLTVPFRMFFYASGHWNLGPVFCKFISMMIHAHMYIAFIFYVVILAVRFITFFMKRDRLEFYRRLHALIASLTVWVVILGLIPVTVVRYGSDNTADSNLCFAFGKALKTPSVAILNYLLCAVLLLVTFVFLAIQLWILGMIYKKHGKTALNHQEFWAQVKSLCFLIVIFICFAPYHAFRIYYVTRFAHEEGESSLNQLQLKNEIFLAVTAFSSSDMLIFISKKRWGSLLPQHCICW